MTARPFMQKKRLVLASESESRADILRTARIAFDAIPSGVDEGALKSAWRYAPSDMALALAEAKAAAIPTDALVLGADQILVCEGRVFDKPASLAAARDNLRTFRGRAHELVLGTVLFSGGRKVWSRRDTATLVMRNFSDDFLDAYLAECGDGICGSVGCYRFESAGARLLESVEGDFYAIRGLPLVALVGALTALGVLDA